MKAQQAVLCGGKMADGGPDERQCIGSINRALKRYGSTCNHVKRLPSDGGVRTVVRHEVEDGDTLQGLALKYGTTMEDIRRANRLWAGDSLFARETLLIPVETAGASSGPGTTAGAFSSADSGNSSDSSAADESPSAILRESHPRRAQPPVPTDQSDSSPSEFLTKIDSAIARTKHQVDKIHSRSQFSLEEEASEDLGQRRRRACASRVSRLRAGATGPETEDRRLRSSLQRLEQSQDDIFEL